MTHIAKLFKNGRSQAVRLPAEFRFEGTEVYIRRDENTGDIILSNRRPAKRSWDELFESMAKRVAEAPEEFEEFGKFIDNRDKSPPKDRHLFDDYDE